jgi:hypothetical protein
MPDLTKTFGKLKSRRSLYDPQALSRDSSVVITSKTIRTLDKMK